MLKLQVLHSIFDLPRDANNLWHRAMRIFLLLPLKRFYDSLLPCNREVRLKVLSSVENEADFVEIMESGKILSL